MVAKSKKKPARTRRGSATRRSPKKTARTRQGSAKASTRVVPPPRDELEPTPPPTPPGTDPGSTGLVTDYPNRSDYEAEISHRAEQQLREGKRPPRTRGPTTEAS